MRVFPAIDLLDGKVVRLARGDYAQVTVYNDDPVAQARMFLEQGATWLHVVDLDGARAGEPRNTAAIKRLVSAAPELRVEVGGGLRSRASIKALLDAGAARVILGSKLTQDSTFIRAAVAEFGADALVAGIDARDGMVAVEGWTQVSALPAAQLVGELACWGLRHLVYTDIARDGMQSGIDAAHYAAIAAAAGFPVIVSGGVATLADVGDVARLGAEVAEGIIIGRALYEGAFSLKEALSALRKAVRPEKGSNTV